VVRRDRACDAVPSSVVSLPWRRSMCTLLTIAGCKHFPYPPSDVSLLIFKFPHILLTDFLIFFPHHGVLKRARRRLRHTLDNIAHSLLRIHAPTYVRVPATHHHQHHRHPTNPHHAASHVGLAHALAHALVLWLALYWLSVASSVFLTFPPPLSSLVEKNHSCSRQSALVSLVWSVQNLLHSQPPLQKEGLQQTNFS